MKSPLAKDNKLLLSSMYSRVKNYFYPEEDELEVRRKLRDVFDHYKRAYGLNKEDQNIKKYAEEIKKYSTALKKKKNLLFVKISEVDGVITWGHPDDMYNTEKQITYVLGKDGQYAVFSGAKADAYIFSDKEYIEIDSGQIKHYGEEKSFTMRPHKIAERNEISKRRFEEFNSGDVQISKPFFVQDFESAKAILLGNDTKKALEEFEKLEELEEFDQFVHTVGSVPYFNSKGELIVGFDPKNSDEPGSKHSIAYKIHKGKVEILISEKTNNLYVAAMKNPGKPNQHIELFRLGSRDSETLDVSIEATKGHKVEIIEREKAIQPCAKFCSVIRESGDARDYGINIFEKSKDFIVSIDITDFDSDQQKTIKSALEYVFLVKRHDTFMYLDKSQLKNSIKAFLKNTKDFNAENLHNSFENIIDECLSKMEAKPKEQEKPKIVKKTPIIAPRNIRPELTNNYKIIREFTDDKCRDENLDPYTGQVYLCYPNTGQFDLKENKGLSFIVEVRQDPFSISIRPEEKEGRNYGNSIIKIGKYEAKIEDGKILYKDENGNYQEKPFEPFKEALMYKCKDCIDHYKNSNLITELGAAQAR